MINFATNYNALGPPVGMETMVRDELQTILYSYVEEVPQLLSRAVGSYLEVPSECVAHGSGSTEILFTLSRLLGHQRAVTFSPSFWAYAAANQAQGNEINTVRLAFSKNFVADLDELGDQLTPNPANAYIANPNNPTSTKIPKASLLSLVRDNEASEFIIDETYLQFNEHFAEETLSKDATVIPNLHVVHSFSKFFASPGIRSGALISDRATIERFKSMQIPYVSSPLGEVVLPWLLKQDAYIAESRRESTIQRMGAYSLCMEFLGDYADFNAPDANFMFARLKFSSAAGLSEYLSTKGIVIRKGADIDPALDNYFRFALLKPAQNIQLMQQAQAYLQTTYT